MQFEVVYLVQRGSGRRPADVEYLRDVRDELAALIAEGRDLAVAVIALTRRARARLAAGLSPAPELDEIERLETRQASRLDAAAEGTTLPALPAAPGVAWRPA